MSRWPYADTWASWPWRDTVIRQPGEQPVVDVALEVAVEEGEPPGVEADVGGIDLALQGRHRRHLDGSAAPPAMCDARPRDDKNGVRPR